MTAPDVAPVSTRVTVIVFDVNENLVKFTQYHAPLKAIVFDYYANFVPYFANLFSPLFVFIAVIFFTSKLASNSEIISMLAAGVSFKRLMRPYMISCVLISTLSFFLSAYVILTCFTAPVSPRSNASSMECFI